MSTYISKEEALEFASKYGLEEEVKYLIEHGHTPYEALCEWDVATDAEFEEATENVRRRMTENAPEFDEAGFTEEDNFNY